MKKLIYLLVFIAFSSSASAQMLFPRLSVAANFAQISVWNTSAFNQYCSGPVYISKRSGLREMYYYSSFVFRGVMDFQNFYNTNHQDPFVMARHSVFCSIR